MRPYLTGGAALFNTSPGRQRPGLFRKGHLPRTFARRLAPDCAPRVTERTESAVRQPSPGAPLAAGRSGCFFVARPATTRESPSRSCPFRRAVAGSCPQHGGRGGDGWGG